MAWSSKCGMLLIIFWFLSFGAGILPTFFNWILFVFLLFMHKMFSSYNHFKNNIYSFKHKYISINKILGENVLFNKKLMILAIFFVSLFVVSAVSAADPSRSRWKSKNPPRNTLNGKPKSKRNFTFLFFYFFSIVWWFLILFQKSASISIFS